MKIWDVRNLNTNSNIISGTDALPNCLISFGRGEHSAPIYGDKWCNNINVTSEQSIYAWSMDGSLRQYNTKNGLENPVIPVMPNKYFPILSFDSSIDGKVGLYCGGNNGGKCDAGQNSIFFFT